MGICTLYGFLQVVKPFEFLKVPCKVPVTIMDKAEDNRSHMDIGFSLRQPDVFCVSRPCYLS